MVSPGRFELPASRLGGARSIQLSYRDSWRTHRIVYLRLIECLRGGSHPPLISSALAGIEIDDALLHHARLGFERTALPVEPALLQGLPTGLRLLHWRDSRPL